MLIGSDFISVAEKVESVEEVEVGSEGTSFGDKVITDFETEVGIRVTPVWVAITDGVAIPLAIEADAINVCTFFE